MNGNLVLFFGLVNPYCLFQEENHSLAKNEAIRANKWDLSVYPLSRFYLQLIESIPILDNAYGKVSCTVLKSFLIILRSI